jgi:hypothetical protein
MISSQPHLVHDGVAFTVYVDYVKRDCLISSEALAQLSELGAGEADPMQTYCAYEANINGVARRLVAAGVAGTPVELGVRNFRDTERRRPG